MADLRLLLGLELRGMFGWNRFRHSRDPRERRRWLLMAAAWVFVGLVLMGYMGMLALGLVAAGLGRILPAYLTVICSALILVFGLFRTGSLLFSPKGYDQLRALPVRPRAIVLSRLATLYVEDAALTLLILLPAAVVYGALTAPGLPFYLTMALGALLIPLLPLCAATAFGVVAAAISARMRRKNLAGTVLTLVFGLGVMALSFSLGTVSEELTPDQLADLAGTLGTVLGSLYPPARWLGEAAQGSLPGLLLFAGVSLAAAALLLAVVSRYFDGILRRLQTTSARKNYRLGALERQSLTKALYRRELRRYFASTVYVTNTIIGPILAVAMSAALLVLGADSLPPLPFDPRPLLPLAVTATLTMMSTASVAVSMEGRQIWQSQCLPIPTKCWLQSKLQVSLTLTLPAWLVCQVLLAVALRPALPQLAGQGLLTLALTVFAPVFGLWVDVKLHRLDWQREEQPVKQGASAMIGGLLPALLCLLCAGGLAALPGHTGLPQGLLCLPVAVLTAFLYRQSCKTDLAAL